MAKKKLKILTSLTYYLPNISGVSVYAEILAQWLAQKNQVTILTSRFKNQLPKTEVSQGIKIIRPWSPIKIGKGILVPSFPIRSLIETLKNDLIICHLPQLESVWLVAWGKLFKKPTLLLHHCEFGDAPGLSRKIVKLLTFGPHYLAYWLTDQIVAYTKDYAQNSIFLKQFLPKVTFILPPVLIKPNPTARLNKTQDKIIGFVGRIGWEKGIDQLLLTIPELKKEFGKVKIFFVGPTKEVVGDKTYQKLKPLFEKYLKEIVFVGPVPHPKLAFWYQMFDCLVLPSTNNLETFGIVQAEAMVCGCPVVASNLPGVRIPIRLTKMGEIVSPRNHRQLARAIIKVVKNREKYSQNQTTAKRIFSYRKFLLSWERLLNKYSTS